MDTLNAAERALLLAAAREAVAAHLQQRPLPAVDPGGPLSDRSGGAFVTLRCAGELRGCIGDLAGGSLVEVVTHCAVAAASADPRFPSLTMAEWPSVGIELSVLGGIEPFDDPQTIEIGRHGLMVERGPHRGLLLPQVATEWGWDRDTFLARTCAKAGLPPDAWRHGARLFRFEAEVFGEAETEE